MVKITKESWIRKRNCAILRFATGLKRKPFSKLMQILCNWHGVSTPPKNISQLGLLFPIYGTYKKCSKPPTRLTSKQTEQTLDTQVPGKNTQRIERAVHIYIYTHNMNWEQKRTTKTRAKICKRLEWSPRKYWGCPRWSPLSGWFLIQPNLVIQYVW